MNTVLQILGIVTLSTPYVWEVWNDKDGDSHISKYIKLPSKTVDIIARCLLAIAAAWLTWFIGIAGFFVSLFMAFAIHFLLFDYTVVYVLIKNKVIAINSKWWDYLGSKGFDNYGWWKNKSWQVRMAIKIAVFVIACVIYF